MRAPMLVVFDGGPLHDTEQMLEYPGEVRIAKPCRISLADLAEPMPPVGLDIVIGVYRPSGRLRHRDGLLLTWRGWSDGSTGVEYVPPGEIRWDHPVWRSAEAPAEPLTLARMEAALESLQAAEAHYYDDHATHLAEHRRFAALLRTDGPEPGADAMRFDPTVGDDEIEAWNEILHPGR